MKRFLGILVLCVLLVTALCGTATIAFAEANDVKFDLTVKEDGEDVVALVTITENDGVVDLYLRVEYDTDALELTERTYGKALSSLGPQDNFEEGGYEYPYRVTYIGSVTNNTDTGHLLTLRFKVKKGAKNGEHSIKLIVRQVGYRTGDLSVDTLYNPKYGEPLEIGADPTSTTQGGVVVEERTVVISGGEVDSIRDPGKEKSKISEVTIGLIVGGSMIVVGAIVIAYLLYRRKNAQNSTSKDKDKTIGK